MSAQFDPYYQWLGIPPEEQPPNLYRLLGLRLYESNLDVIGNAADRQMVFVRTFQTGENSSESQKLLNEISQARIILTDENRKRKYDSELQSGSLQANTPGYKKTGEVRSTAPAAAPDRNAPGSIIPKGAPLEWLTPQVALPTKEKPSNPSPEVRPAAPPPVPVSHVTPAMPIPSGAAHVTPAAPIPSGAAHVTPVAPIFSGAAHVTPAAPIPSSAAHITPVAPIPSGAAHVTPAAPIETSVPGNWQKPAHAFTGGRNVSQTQLRKEFEQELQYFDAADQQRQKLYRNIGIAAVGVCVILLTLLIGVLLSRTFAPRQIRSGTPVIVQADPQLDVSSKPDLGESKKTSPKRSMEKNLPKNQSKSAPKSKSESALESKTESEATPAALERLLSQLDDQIRDHSDN